jgi:hypothetical protein
MEPRYRRQLLVGNAADRDSEAALKQTEKEESLLSGVSIEMP